MQYYCLQHWILLLSPVTSTSGCFLFVCFWFFFCFGSIPSFFLELFFHWSAVAYWAPTDLGSSYPGWKALFISHQQKERHCRYREVNQCAGWIFSGLASSAHHHSWLQVPDSEHKVYFLGVMFGCGWGRKDSQESSVIFLNMRLGIYRRFYWSGLASEQGGTSFTMFQMLPTRRRWSVWWWKRPYFFFFFFLKYSWSAVLY